jgi:hypothetical protein
MVGWGDEIFSCRQDFDQAARDHFAASADVVNELDQAQIARSFVRLS